ncbi:MAG: hypothetical protein AAF514_07800, partial [Verrucomicrobiota bacterium]
MAAVQGDHGILRAEQIGMPELFEEFQVIGIECRPNSQITKIGVDVDCTSAYRDRRKLGVWNKEQDFGFCEVGSLAVFEKHRGVLQSRPIAAFRYSPRQGAAGEVD